MTLERLPTRLRSISATLSPHTKPCSEWRRVIESGCCPLNHDDRSCGAFSLVDVTTGLLSGRVTAVKHVSFTFQKVEWPTACHCDIGNTFLRFSSGRRYLYPEDHDQGFGSLCDNADTIGDKDWGVHGRILDESSS